jgi:peptidoglycan/LPS O-acetylase OafA/YrhL
MSSVPPSSAHGRVETIDALRLFAALSVVLFHYSFRGAAADDMTWLSLPAIAPVTKYGFLGVQLFFVISGFVISYSAEGRTVRQFAIARAARIYPGFVAVMTLTFLVLLAIGAPRTHTSLVQWAANLVIVSPALNQPFMDGVYWSIVYELVFYGWIALVIASGQFPRRVPPLVAGWLLLSLANEVLLHSGALRRLFLTDHSAFFAAGMMLYILYSGRGSVLNWALLAAATAVAVVQADWAADWTREHYTVTLSHIAIAAIVIGSVALVGGCLIVTRVPLSAKVMMTLGGLTYPLYLIHQMVGFAIFNRFEGVAPASVMAPAVIVLMLAASWAIYRFIERPGQKLAKTVLGGILPRSYRTRPRHETSGVMVFAPVTVPAPLRHSRPTSATSSSTT